MTSIQFIRDECRCEDVRDNCSVCGKPCKLIDLVWDSTRRKVVCIECVPPQSPNGEVRDPAT